MNRKTTCLLGCILGLVLLVGPASSQETDTVPKSPGPQERTSPAGEDRGKDRPATEARLTPRDQTADLREIPSPFSPVKFTMQRGETAYPAELRGDWVQLRLDDGRTGWAYRSLFAAAPPDPGTPAGESRPGASTEKGSEAEKADVRTRLEGAGPGIHIDSTENNLMSLNFLDVDIREALSALAMEREINVAAAHDVSGRITVHLYHVTLEEALTAISLAGGFSYHRQDDLYYVFKSKMETDPEAERLQMRIYRLLYADVNQVREVLEGLPRMRKIKIHEPSRTIIAEDTPENIDRIGRIISRLDLKPKQVMIEAKILEVTLTDDMALGVNWNDIIGDVTLGTGGFSTATIPLDQPVSPVPSTGRGLFGNLIAAAGTNKQFAAALDLLQNKTRVDTLSTPKILAIHGKPAKVQVGGQQGYKVTTTNVGVATETIQFIDTGTILDITPYIDDDGNVLLNVKPSINAAKIEGGIPVVSSTVVSTWLMARNGETVFIGGLIQDREAKTRDMIPCLGSIPGLGAAFGRTVSGLGKSELVVLITPNIIDAGQGEETREILEKTGKIEKRFDKGLPSTPGRIFDFIMPVK